MLTDKLTYSNMKYPYELPSLNYDYKDLEPHIDTQTMEIHHTKHHQGYLNKLNAALEANIKYQASTLEELLKEVAMLPEDLRKVVKSSGGGYYNHNIFFETLTKDSPMPPTQLRDLIHAQFESMQVFQQKFTEVAMAHFGSGWCWLVLDANGKLEIETTVNQDNPVMFDDTKVLFGVDLWEHAYYLKYQNRRADYLEAIWNIVDWDVVAKRMN